MDRPAGQRSGIVRKMADESKDWRIEAAAALRGLEEHFRLLVRDLPHSLEPATTFRVDGDSEP